ncbi:MAG: nucleoside deaminase [Epsilonproteobacteria bacterium]|nr:nucleoside deaminase [Campylobacterota bacterium]
MTIPDDKKDFFMQKALKQALRALEHEEVPIGAVVVNEKGEIIGRGYNKTEKKQCQTAHAEIIAIEKACKKKGSWRLNGCWIYVTLEPCLMCFGLIQLSRLEGVIFGTTSNLFGFRINKTDSLPPYAKNLQIVENVNQEECVQLLQHFFRTIRKKGKGTS